ncbi:MAG: NAD(P)H-dependent oxidoreductase [Erysipelotrichales bacterium]
MSKVLVINANAKNAKESRTLALTELFVNEYKKNNPGDQVEYLNLYEEDMRFLDESLLGDIAAGKDTVAKFHATKFSGYDKYIYSTPMWNLGAPAIMKAYMDYVMYTGITFKYTESGAVGLLNDKPRKAINIVSRGGAYEEEPMKSIEFGTSYLKAVSHFMGIAQFDTLAFEMTNVLVGEDFDKALKIAEDKAIEQAKSF